MRRQQLLRRVQPLITVLQQPNLSASRRALPCLAPEQQAVAADSRLTSVSARCSTKCPSEDLAPAYPRFRYPTHEVPIIANPYVKPSTQHAATQIRWATKGATADQDNKISIGPQSGGQSGEDDKEAGVVYYGPISSTIKKVKLLSLSTCCLSVSMGPVVTFMSAPEMNVILKGALATSVIFLSASTTYALHWFVSPYIHKIRWQPGSDSFEVDKMSWLATYLTKTVRFADIRPPQTNRPFVTFKANGEYYFVDTEHCHNKALLARLTPRKEDHESAFKNL